MGQSHSHYTDTTTVVQLKNWAQYQPHFIASLRQVATEEELGELQNRLSECASKRAVCQEKFSVGDGKDRVLEVEWAIRDDETIMLVTKCATGSYTAALVSENGPGG